jgi:hypothetical protein
MYGGIESSRIIRAFQRHVPEVFIRDYVANNGYLVICKGYRTIHDHSRNTSHYAENIPAQTLANLRPGGWTPEVARYNGMALVVPGWRQEMRRAAPYLTDYQKEAISRELGAPVFSCH